LPSEFATRRCSEILVGLVHLALAAADGVTGHREIFPGDRQAVRLATLERALAMIADAVL
jgi:nicotinamide-nucleotide amidase